MKIYFENTSFGSGYYQTTFINDPTHHNTQIKYLLIYLTFTYTTYIHINPILQPLNTLSMETNSTKNKFYFLIIYLLDTIYNSLNIYRQGKDLVQKLSHRQELRTHLLPSLILNDNPKFFEFSLLFRFCFLINYVSVRQRCNFIVNQSSYIIVKYYAEEHHRATIGIEIGFEIFEEIVVEDFKFRSCSQIIGDFMDSKKVSDII